MKRLLVLYALVFFLPFFGRAQDTSANRDTLKGNLHGSILGEGSGTTSGVVPFWMRSNQYGSIPLDGPSISIIGNGYKEYSDKNKVVDWGAGINVRINAGKKVELVFIEAYAKARLSIFQIMAGRSKSREGLMDSALSSGSFTIAGNALGIPKLELSIPNYWSIPFTSNLIAIKGDFSHGWLGQQVINSQQYFLPSDSLRECYFHHMSAYGRFGKPNWRLKLYGAINHDATWGSEKGYIYAKDSFPFSKIESFYFIATGKYNPDYEWAKIGNHTGSLDVAAEYEFKNVQLKLYHQFFYDKGALYFLANIKDGLTGISISNKKNNYKTVGWRKLLVELFYSKDQAGEENAIHTPSGPEFYYNHTIYVQGFSYNGIGNGTPLITERNRAKKGQVFAKDEFFINNRVVALHLGGIGNYKKWQVLIKTTYSKNYGTYGTSGPDIQWVLNAYHPISFPNGKFIPVNQFSGYFEASRKLEKNMMIGFVLAGDYGNLLDKSIGAAIRVTKSW